MGLLDPATSDGRIIFFLPWEGKTIAGTTDRKCDVTYNPEPTEEEVEFIINEVKNYLSPDVKGLHFWWFDLSMVFPFVYIYIFALWYLSLRFMKAR